MIDTLYDKFKHWSDGGSVYILSDLHLNDSDCKFMDKYWISPDAQIDIINDYVKPNDTFICLGDVGDASYISRIKSRYKILILGNHDKKKDYVGLFNEIYSGPLFISDKLLLSHEPIKYPYGMNIHGHDHSNTFIDDMHMNLAANVCGYIPYNLGKGIRNGLLSNIKDIHRCTIDAQKGQKKR